MRIPLCATGNFNIFFLTRFKYELRSYTIFMKLFMSEALIGQV